MAPRGPRVCPDWGPATVYTVVHPIPEWGAEPGDTVLFLTGGGVQLRRDLPAPVPVFVREVTGGGGLLSENLSEVQDWCNRLNSGGPLLRLLRG